MVEFVPENCCQQQTYTIRKQKLQTISQQRAGLMVAALHPGSKGPSPSSGQRQNLVQLDNTLYPQYLNLHACINCCSGQVHHLGGCRNTSTNTILAFNTDFFLYLSKEKYQKTLKENKCRTPLQIKPTSIHFVVRDYRCKKKNVTDLYSR